MQVCVSCGKQGIPVIHCPALFPLFILTVTGSDLALPAVRQSIKAKLLPPLLHVLHPAVVKHSRADAQQLLAQVRRTHKKHVPVETSRALCENSEK